MSHTNLSMEDRVLKTVGIVGLGNMGLGMARNLLKKGFAVRGYDKRPEGLAALSELGGIASGNANEVAQEAAAIFLMVMNADQVEEIIAGGLLDAMAPGATLIVSATIGAGPVQELANRLAGKRLHLIDAPVSGGKAGAEAGTLTLMVATPGHVLEGNKDVLMGIGSHLIHVGEAPGQGQIVKSCLQALIGVSFEGLFEAIVLGAEAGVSPEVLGEVINNSFVGSKLTAVATDHIVARRFRNTGSHISTMHKDIGISLDMARRLKVPVPATEVAMQMFSSAFAAIPDGDNWCIVELLESMTKAGVERNKA